MEVTGRGLYMITCSVPSPTALRSLACDLETANLTDLVERLVETPVAGAVAVAVERVRREGEGRGGFRAWLIGEGEVTPLWGSMSASIERFATQTKKTFLHV